MRESAELRDAMLQMYRAMTEGTIAAYFDRTVSRAPGALFLGTDPDEVWDREGLLRAGSAQVELGLRAEPGEVRAYAEGDAGWTADPGARLRFGDQEIPVRVSAVWRREEGAWRMVHFHTSIGVPNEEAVGQELPT